MWVVTTGKKAHLIQCTNYDCMCRFIITDDEISKDVLEMKLDSSTKYIPVKLGSMHCMLIIFDANEVRHADLQYISSRFLRFDSHDFDERLCLFDDLNLETLEDLY